MEEYCYSCHGKEKQKADLNLSVYTTIDSVAQDYPRWQSVLDKLDAEEMPPDDAKRQPDAAAVRGVKDWIHALRKFEADSNAGDPGPVLVRRLSNAEYDYTIRDLTGVDLRPTREFPVDPANEAGFDNSGESLTMSPALLKKYLEAARGIAEHLVLKPHGFSFAAFPLVGDTDRDKYAVQQIMAFYRRQHTDYADFFLAAWKYREREALGRPQATLDDFAAEAGLSPKYLATLWSTLNASQEAVGPIAALQALWRELPHAASHPVGEASLGCQRMRDFIQQLRPKLTPEVKNMAAPGIQNGNQAFVLWKDREMAKNRRRYAGNATLLPEDETLRSTAAFQAMAIPTEPALLDAYEGGFTRFCSIFPDTFVMSERARIFISSNFDPNNAGRFLSAGFHSTMGYFRDDGPLCELILDDHGRAELDELWRELDFITDAPQRQHSGFIWSERTDSPFMRGREFDFARAEDKDCGSDAKIQQLTKVYLDKASRKGASELAQQILRDHFAEIAGQIRAVEKARVDAEPRHVEALQEFAGHAFRRPLTDAERRDIVNFYHSLREQEGLSHEDAVRDTLASILVSPYFCYRADLVDAEPGVHPLSDYALASRLSYFLWSSMPDDKLLARAAAGELHRPEVITAEAHRMLQDDRAHGLAVEFAGNWLDIRRFEEHNAVDRERFPAFTNDLREAMFQEPLHFFLDVARQDRSVLDFLYANRTFVNPALAKYYGLPDDHRKADEWTEIDDAKPYGRGGLLPMAAFLTKNAPGDRTSPVKRGNWVIRRLLGERVPPPPAKVPELPSDEAKLGKLTLREALAEHRNNKSCAGCHEKFDSIGLAFEGYGPVGELRKVDLGGRPVDASAVFPDGSAGAGVDGLLSYIHQRRQSDFVHNLSSKLLSYALGRGIMLSDDRTLQTIEDGLAAHDYRFSALVDAIVTSPQFLQKRGQSAPTVARAESAAP